MVAQAAMSVCRFVYKTDIIFVSKLEEFMPLCKNAMPSCSEGEGQGSVVGWNGYIAFW